MNTDREQHNKTNDIVSEIQFVPGPTFDALVSENAVVGYVTKDSNYLDADGKRGYGLILESIEAGQMPGQFQLALGQRVAFWRVHVKNNNKSVAHLVHGVLSAHNTTDGHYQVAAMDGAGKLQFSWHQGGTITRGWSKPTLGDGWFAEVETLLKMYPTVK